MSRAITSSPSSSSPVSRNPSDSYRRVAPVFDGTTLVLAAVTPSSRQCSSTCCHRAPADAAALVPLGDHEPPQEVALRRVVEGEDEADGLPVGVDRPHPVPGGEVGLRDRDRVRRDERALVGRHLELADRANGLGRDLAELDVHPREATTRRSTAPRNSSPAYAPRTCRAGFSLGCPGWPGRSRRCPPSRRVARGEVQGSCGRRQLVANGAQHPAGRHPVGVESCHSDEGRDWSPWTATVGFGSSCSVRSRRGSMAARSRSAVSGLARCWRCWR